MTLPQKINVKMLAQKFCGLFSQIIPPSKSSKLLPEKQQKKISTTICCEKVKSTTRITVAHLLIVAASHTGNSDNSSENNGEETIKQLLALLDKNKDKNRDKNKDKNEQNLLINYATIKKYINCRDEKGYTPLHYAIVLGANGELVEKLIQAGANLNEPLPDGVTPLQWLSENKKYELLKIFLQNGAYCDNVNSINDEEAKKIIGEYEKTSKKNSIEKDVMQFHPFIQDFLYLFKEQNNFDDYENTLRELGFTGEQLRAITFYLPNNKLRTGGVCYGLSLLFYLLEQANCWQDFLTALEKPEADANRKKIAILTIICSALQRSQVIDLFGFYQTTIFNFAFLIITRLFKKNSGNTPLPLMPICNGTSPQLKYISKERPLDVKNLKKNQTIEFGIYASGFGGHSVCMRIDGNGNIHYFDSNIGYFFIPKNATVLDDNCSFNHQTDTKWSGRDSFRIWRKLKKIYAETGLTNEQKQSKAVNYLLRKAADACGSEHGGFTVTMAVNSNVQKINPICRLVKSVVVGTTTFFGSTVKKFLNTFDSSPTEGVVKNQYFGNTFYPRQTF